MGPSSLPLSLPPSSDPQPILSCKQCISTQADMEESGTIITATYKPLGLGVNMHKYYTSNLCHVLCISRLSFLNLVMFFIVHAVCLCPSSISVYCSCSLYLYTNSNSQKKEKRKKKKKKKKKEELKKIKS